MVNAGSATLKLSLVEDDDTTSTELVLDVWDGHPESAAEAITSVTAGVDAVGHRVVHGGTAFTSPVAITDAIVDELVGLTPLAPLHQPRSLAALAAARRVLPGVVHVACFDTGFHATMPAGAHTYALPLAWRERWALRRYGFHGLSHAWAARRATQLTSPTNVRIVTCHLGAGASLCAVLDGRSVDTTMGFTPLDGLVMQTRSGSLDPGLVLWLITTAGVDAVSLADELERHSGLAGLSRTSGDMRTVLQARHAAPDAALAYEVYLHRLRREIAAMTAALGGIDALVFTGGVGENSPEVRADTVKDLVHLGVAIDPERNERASTDSDISDPAADARVLVVHSREDVEIATHTRRLAAAPK